MAFFRSGGILNSSKGFFGGVVVGGGGGGGGGSYPNLDSIINISELRVRWTGNWSRGRVSTSVRNGTFYDPGNPFSANESWEIAGAVKNVGATGFEVEYDGSIFINFAYVPYMSHYKWQDWSTNSSFDPGYDDPANHSFGSLWETIIGDAASLADSTYGGLPNPCLLRMFIGWDKYYWLDSRVPYYDGSIWKYLKKNKVVLDRQFDPPIGVLNEFAVFVP